MNTNPKAKRILCFGDSNTRGYIPGSMGMKRYDVFERWTGILQNLLGNDFEIIEESLDGRTTNIEVENKNATGYLPIVLASHRPLDWIIIALGTNDLKNKFNKTPKQIAQGLEELINLTKSQLNESKPKKYKILILSPAIINESIPGVKDDFIGGEAKSKQLSEEFEIISKKYNCEFIKLSEYITTSIVDGYHLDLEAHKKIAELVYKKIIYKNINLEKYDEVKHFKVMQEWYSNPELMRFMGMEVMSVEELKGWLHDKTRINLIFTDKDTNIIGTVNFYNYKTKFPEYEIGYLVDRVYQGQGYGKEIVKLALDYAKNELKITKLTQVYVEDFNIASRKILESLNFNLDKYDESKKRYYYSINLQQNYSELLARVKQIVINIHELKKVCYTEYDLPINYLTIFTQSNEDFNNLQIQLLRLGSEVEANNGFKYKLNGQIEILSEKINLIRIRKPDIHRKELGCADLSYKEEDYQELRAIALNKSLDIIIRKNYEMIELADKNINVYAYLVKNN